MNSITTQELAVQLKAAIEAADLATIHNELFAETVESIEPQFAPIPHAKGIDQVKEKARLFGGNLKEMHSRSISDEVLVSGDHISLGMSFDATLQDGNRMQISELIVYQVAEGKVVREQIFY